MILNVLLIWILYFEKILVYKKIKRDSNHDVDQMSKFISIKTWKTLKDLEKKM